MANSGRPVPHVVVVGSVHMDLIAKAARLPRPGESLLGSGFAMFPGGKGGNQAVAAAQQGAPTAIVARVGDDAFGNQLRDSLARKGVDVSFLQTDVTEATGVSPVLMSAGGDYASIIVPGASQSLTPALLAPASDALCSCTVLMLQLEISLATSSAAARMAAKSGATVIMNAAPAPDLLEAANWEIWRYVSLVIVNRDEAEALSGVSIGAATRWIEVAIAVRTRLGIASAVVTLGSEGAALADASGEIQLAAYDVPVVDTIGAGDAFAGAVAAALARGVNLREAVRLGNAAGALAVGRMGAYNAPPTLEETMAIGAGVSRRVG